MIRRTPIRIKLSKCKGCKKPRPNFSHGFCKSCARKTYGPIRRTSLKKQGVYNLKKTPLLRKYKPTGELDIFKQIWELRPHTCTICLTPIVRFDHNNFAHILSKGAYKKLRLVIENISLLCHSKIGDGCHNKYDTKSMEDLIKQNQRWKILQLKAQELKQKYYADNKVTKK